MNNFEFANKATDKLKLAAKLPGMKRSIKRAFEGSRDSVTDCNLDLQDKIDDLRTKLYTCDKKEDKKSILDAIVEANQEIKDNEDEVEILKKEEKLMYAEAPVVKED
jgi:hypothetical protein